MSSIEIRIQRQKVHNLRGGQLSPSDVWKLLTLTETLAAELREARATIDEIRVMARTASDLESERREGHFSGAVESFQRIARASDRILNNNHEDASR